MTPHDLIAIDPPWTYYGDPNKDADEFYQRVERMYPQATKCELFARRGRPGWMGVGDQLDPPSQVRIRSAA